MWSSKAKISLVLLIFPMAICLNFFIPQQKGNGQVYIPKSQTNIYLPLLINKTPFLNLFGVTVTQMNSSLILDQLTNTNTGWTRLESDWSTIETTPGARLWDTNFDLNLLNIANHQMQPIVILESTPGWALKTGFSCGAVSSDKFSVLGQFVYDLVKRYSAFPYNVHYWELWNEPDAANILGCWGDPSDQNYYGGSYYGQMLMAIYPQIKAADPQAQVLVGGLLLDCPPNCPESKFLKGILASGAGNSFDGISFHAYDFYWGKGTYGNTNWQSAWNTTGPVSIIKSNYIKGLLTSYGVQGKYLLNTETAIFYGPNLQDPPCVAGSPPFVEVTKAYYVIHTYTAALAEGWKANIWYSDKGVRCSGLFKTDLTPEPAYYAYQFAQQQLGDASFDRTITGFNGVKGYEFLAKGTPLMVLWSLDGNNHPILIQGVVSSIIRIGDDGKPYQETPSNNIIINSSPRFIKLQQ